MRGEAAALQEAASGAANADPIAAHRAAGAPFTGEKPAAAEDDSGFTVDPTLRWTYSPGSPVRLRIGGEGGLSLEVRNHGDLVGGLQAIALSDVGYYIVDPDVAHLRYKGLRDGEEVVLGPDSPSRFAWPAGLTDKVLISRKGDVIEFRTLEGQPVELEPAPPALPARRPVYMRRSRDGRAALLTVRHPHRSENEDAVGFDVKRGIIIVADGVGGVSGARVASSIAKRVILRHLRKNLTRGATRAQVERLLRVALEKANDAILRYAELHPEVKGMGTTVSVGVLLPGGMVTANVGDSGIFVRSPSGRLRRVTGEQSLTEEMKAKMLHALAKSGVDVDRVLRRGRVGKEDITKAVRELRRLARSDMEYFKLDPVVVQALRAPGLRQEVRLDAYNTILVRNVVSSTLGVGRISPQSVSIRYVRMRPKAIALGATDGALDNIPPGLLARLFLEADTLEDLVISIAANAQRISTRPLGPEEKAYSKKDDISTVAMRARSARKKRIKARSSAR